MNTLIDRPQSATHSDGVITIRMESGLEFTFPCHAYPRLAAATNAQRSDIELSPMGLHWPGIDEDLSIRSLLRDHANL